ncbi:MAG: hypothetical protein HOY76_16690 [Streptomyces sp.]|nr:hypothetical protein [Streptomyces sp.]NUS84617.1 hypothetical protein [Streptomyces sp.]
MAGTRSGRTVKSGPDGVGLARGLSFADGGAPKSEGVPGRLGPVPPDPGEQPASSRPTDKAATPPRSTP